ncbi:MAG: type II toxin-antitoxin system RelE/ParE family toxin [Gammaproteobacteria bacterium]|nr:type II toxin-antitoxin system RelE/ParE family toxin [Gammaproteobacteria bacterium]
MEKYEILFKRSAFKELDKLPKKDVQRIVEKIRGLSHGLKTVSAEKLAGDEKFRVRQGDYRIICLLDEENGKIVIYKIGHRRDVYRK